MPVFLDNRLPEGVLSELMLKRRVGKVLKALGRGKEVSLTVLLAGDAELQALNRDFRGRDCPTNVLAFPFQPGDGRAGGEDIPFPKPPRPLKGYLGDVAVSFETVSRQAEEEDSPTGELLYFYLIHGILHLMGLDHELGPTEAEAQDRETQRLMQLIPHTLK